MDLLLAALLTPVVLGEGLVHVLATYGLIVACLGRLRPRAEIVEDEGARFLVIIPAHDEAAVIAASVQSLQAQRYPADRRAIVVLADRCTDATAAIASQAGAEVVERPVSAQGAGKPRAIGWLLETLGARLDQFDAIVVIDADNRADPDLLRRFAGRLRAGEKVVQAFTGVIGAATSRTSRWSAIGFWAINHLGQEPRERLGLSAAVGGTGVAVASSVLRSVPWRMRSLTEDLELGALLALAGVRVAFEAVRVQDEKPSRLSVSVAQRRRWMQGRFDVVGRYFLPLLRATFRRGDLRALDVALALVSPSLAFAGVFAGALGVGRAVLLAVAPAWGLPTVAAIAGVIPPGAAITAALCYYGSTLIALRAERAAPVFYWAAITAPFYLALSVPLAISGWLRRRDRTWIRTPHTGGSADPDA